MQGDTSEIDYEAEIELTSENSEYDREARGKLVIDGPDGKLMVLKTYRAMIDESKGLQEPGKIVEHSRYFRDNESESFTDGSHEWDVPEDVLTDESAFVKDCLAEVEADPQIEYEERSDRL